MEAERYTDTYYDKDNYNSHKYRPFPCSVEISAFKVGHFSFAVSWAPQFIVLASFWEPNEELRLMSIIRHYFWLTEESSLDGWMVGKKSPVIVRVL
jgi:hypothetical protein